MVGIFAAAKHGVIAQRKELCERGKAYCMMVDVDGLALLNCLEACQLRQTGGQILVLNVGSAYTNVAILSDDGLPFVRDIPYAAEAIVTQVSRSASQPKQAVADALAGGDENQIRPWQPTLKKACGTLADRVHETVRYYGTRGSGPVLDRVLLCGGFVQSQAVTDTLTSLLGGKVERWNPLAMLPVTRSVRKNEVFEQGSAFAVALGLAMRSLRDVHD
jgi:Tfp pilus assembly PilM family ATPase